VTLNDLAKYSMARSVARSLCDSCVKSAVEPLTIRPYDRFRRNASVMLLSSINQRGFHQTATS